MGSHGAAIHPAILNLNELNIADERPVAALVAFYGNKTFDLLTDLING